MLMRRIQLAVPAFVLATGAASALAQTVQVIPAVPVQSQVVIAPSAPPPARIETIPPPPVEQSQVMYWRPGHWAWDGASWSWSEGQYVARPSSQAVWEPGHWIQQPTGGYVWVDGRWRS